MAKVNGLDTPPKVFVAQGKSATLLDKYQQLRYQGQNKDLSDLALISGTLKVMLKKNDDVHVMLRKEVVNSYDFDNRFLAEEIYELLTYKRIIVFPYAIAPQHHISVVVDVDNEYMIVTDSLHVDRTSDENIRHLASLLNITDVRNGNAMSNYQKQNCKDALGVYTVLNTIDIVTSFSFPDGEKKESLSDEQLQEVLRAKIQFLEEEKLLRREKEQSLAKHRFILGEVMAMKENEGVDPEDDLEKLAFILQVKEHVIRREIESALYVEESLSERDVEEMIKKYEEDHKYDYISIVLLRALKRNEQYQEARNYRDKILLCRFDEYKKMKRDEQKLFHLGAFYFFAEEYQKAERCFSEVIEGYSFHNLLINFGVAISSNLNKVVYGMYREVNRDDLLETLQASREWDFTDLPDGVYPVAVSLRHIGSVYIRAGPNFKGLEMVERASAITEALDYVVETIDDSEP